MQSLFLLIMIITVLVRQNGKITLQTCQDHRCRKYVEAAKEKKTIYE